MNSVIFVKYLLILHQRLDSQYMFDSPFLNIIASALLAFGIVFYIIPSIINIARIKNLYDTENGRKSHIGSIPNLGGVAIFGAFIITYGIFGDFTEPTVKYILSALSFVFMIGAKDDIVELTPSKKFLGQIIAASIVVVLGGIRLTSFYGLFGISQLPEVVSILFSVITVVFIINAFNLVDGVNWLAGGLALVVTGTFGAWFFIHGYMDYAVMSACVLGAVLAFMKYNYTPAKIFLGDSGSLSIGLLMAAMALLFIEESSIVLRSQTTLPFHVISGPAIAVAVLIIPIFDTFKVFTARILKGRSPFSPDKTHHHHKLLDLGFSHVQASVILITVNVGFIIFTFKMQHLRNAILIPLIFLIAFLLSSFLYMLKPSSKKISNSSDKHITGTKIEMKNFHS